MFNEHLVTSKGDYTDDNAAAKYKTKIILCNKIAESSITIDGVTVVIDTGLAKESIYDATRRITIVRTDRISAA